MKQDLRDQGSQELSLIVFNDEYLYNLRNRTASLLEAINESYIYTDEQLAELKQDIEDDIYEL